MLLRKLIKGIISWLKKLWIEAKLQARLDKIEREYKIKFDKEITQVSYTKQSFVYNFLYSLRQKIDDPLGKKRNIKD